MHLVCLIMTFIVLLLSSESLVSFPSAAYEVEEDIGEALIPIRREGDLSDELMLICETRQGEK